MYHRRVKASEKKDRFLSQKSKTNKQKQIVFYYRRVKTSDNTDRFLS